VIPQPPPRPDLLGLATPGTLETEPERGGPKGLPAVTWRWWEAIGLYLIGNLLIGEIVVAGIAFALMGVHTIPEGGADTPTVVATLADDVAFFVVLAAWLTWRHPGWRDMLGVPRRAATLVREALWGVVAGVVLYFAVAIVVAVPLTILFNAFSSTEVSTPEQVSPDVSVWGKILAVVLAVAIAPIAEELFFRGLLFRSIRDRRGFATGAVASAALFGLVHYVPSPWKDALLLQSIMVFTGFALAWIYERRASIAANMVAHMTFNAIGITLIFLVR
jgi:membrane protease YdiL (CAAX protease family)